MSTAALGASRVGRVMTALALHGYRCARVSASGQRRGARRDENAVAGDIVALAAQDGLPHLIVEVGGAGKRLRRSFSELRASTMPGFAPLVVRFVNRRRWVYLDEDRRFSELEHAIAALRAA